MFVHVTCEHVKHDYAPVYTIDVALPPNICTEQVVAQDTTEDTGLFCTECNAVNKCPSLDFFLSILFRI